jgi:hypothetical protein
MAPADREATTWPHRYPGLTGWLMVADADVAVKLPVWGKASSRVQRATMWRYGMRCCAH